MTDILIREVDDATVRALRRKADQLKQPIEAVARDILQREVERGDASRPVPTAEEVRERVAAADRIRARQLRPSDIDSTDLIRADRDSR